MITVKQARGIADAYVSSIANGSEPLEIIDSATISRPYGWMFFYQSSRYLETNDPTAMLAGNAPFIVNAATGSITVTGTAQSTEYYLSQYEASHGTGAA